LSNASKLQRLKLLNNKFDIYKFDEIHIRVKPSTIDLIDDDTINYKDFVTKIQTIYFLFIAEYKVN